MNGCGNSFILIDNRQSIIEDRSKLAIEICDVNFGVGADGLILAEKSLDHDIRMRIFNSDGSESEMCGNGIRCFTLFLNHLNIGSIQNSYFQIETLTGLIKARILELDENMAQVEVDMGRPSFQSSDFIETSLSVGNDNLGSYKQAHIDGRDFILVSMGNPHAVTFVDNYDFPYSEIGATIERNQKIFPNRVNVEFVKFNSETFELEMRVWERGCGETLACGTGACASVVAATLRSFIKVGQKTKVHLKGGTLGIRWQEDFHVLMQGPATHVFDGFYSIN